MEAFFFAVGILAGIWCAVRTQVLYHKLVGSFPPQFQDDLSSRYAFPVLALSASTPLPLQAEYINCQYAGCVCLLCISLGGFFVGNAPFGGLGLIATLCSAVSTFRSIKIYKENCLSRMNEKELR